MTAASVLIAVPVYQGAELIGETIRSIREQEFEDYRVLISIDGPDEPSCEACLRSIGGDPRFHVCVQRVRMGWAANLNWLMNECTEPFFCYWQQDDLCATSYLRLLHDHALEHPEAACCYSDLQWFGARIERETLPSLTGGPLDRVLTQMEKGHFAPFRGLIRRDAMKRAGPLRSNEYDSLLEDLVWVAKLAREGELHRVEGTLYFKRAHRGNAHSTSRYSRPLPDSVRRGAWIEYGLGMLEAALPLVPVEDQRWLLATIQERLAAPRKDRWRFYDSDAEEYVPAAVERYGMQGLGSSVDWNRRIALVRRNGGYAALKQAAETIRANGRIQTGFESGSAGAALLMDGWSQSENWGTWSESDRAALFLPLPAGDWIVQVSGRGFGGGLEPGQEREAALRIRSTTIARVQWTPERPVFSVEFTLREVIDETIVEFEISEIVSPAELGISDDTRRLGIGLERLTIRPLREMSS